ncbi:MAG: hypothetical protein KIS30_08865 [Thermoplasmata archaeon]|nr:hypothetical protein [Candidatus Sysuiplasma acidicola]MBX8646850.1 hypothetical protein [Candidatus Sysuiplasma acidicola]MDH2905817.1 hypothetical protein [Methanomassiliicoccales archaeon]
MSESSTPSSKKGKGISTGAFAATVVILLIVAGAGWALYAVRPSTAAPSASVKQQVTSLAYEHWQAIGVENLSQTMSQYTSGSVLYWSVKGSVLNGTYTNKSTIESTWSKFFSHDPVDYYSVYNFKISISGNVASVTADLWYIVLINQSAKLPVSGLTPIKGNSSVNSTVATLILPYLLTYHYSNGLWHLTSDWWGLPSPHQGFVVKGIVEQFANLSPPSNSTGSSPVGGYY